MILLRRCFTLALVLVVVSCDQPDEAACKYDTENPDNPVKLDNVILERVDGGREDLGDYLGKVIVLNIWATWCAPCRYEMPDLQALSDRLDPDKAVVMGISIDRVPVATVREYLNRNNITFTNYYDTKQTIVWDKWGVNMLPETFIFAPDGCLSERTTGRQEWNSNKVFNFIIDLMDDKDSQSR